MGTFGDVWGRLICNIGLFVSYVEPQQERHLVYEEVEKVEEDVVNAHN